LEVVISFQQHVKNQRNQNLSSVREKSSWGKFALSNWGQGVADIEKSRNTRVETNLWDNQCQGRKTSCHRQIPRGSPWTTLRAKNLRSAQS
jgi:hypothetical protein